MNKVVRSLSAGVVAGLSIAVAVGCSEEGSSGSLEETPVPGVSIVRTSVARPFDLPDLLSHTDVVVAGSVAGDPEIVPFRNEEFGDTLDLPYLKAHFNYTFIVEQVIAGRIASDEITLRWVAPNPDLELPDNRRVIFSNVEFMEPVLTDGEYVLFLDEIAGEPGTYWVSYQNYGSVLSVNDQGKIGSAFSGLSALEGLSVEDLEVRISAATPGVASEDE